MASREYGSYRSVRKARSPIQAERAALAAAITHAPPPARAAKTASAAKLPARRRKSAPRGRLFTPIACLGATGRKRGSASGSPFVALAGAPIERPRGLEHEVLLNRSGRATSRYQVEVGADVKLTPEAMKGGGAFFGVELDNLGGVRSGSGMPWTARSMESFPFELAVKLVTGYLGWGKQAVVQACQRRFLLPAAGAQGEQGMRERQQPHPIGRGGSHAGGLPRPSRSAAQAAEQPPVARAKTA
jgi:hypothetical protein